MNVQVRRRECRDAWLSTVALAWDRLDPDVRRHCVDDVNLARWWPEVTP